jgi:hypothetical protein
MTNWAARTISLTLAGAQQPLNCTVDWIAQRTIRPFVYLVFQPYLLEGTHGVPVIIAPTGELKNYKVIAAKLEKSANAPISFLVFDISDGEHVVNIIKRGKEITLIILPGQGMPPFEWIKAVFEGDVPPAEEVIAYFPLANDATFVTEYDVFYRKVQARRHH